MYVLAQVRALVQQLASSRAGTPKGQQRNCSCFGSAGENTGNATKDLRMLLLDHRMEGEIEWIHKYPENHYKTLAHKSQGDH
jgi:hypothetical protein